MIIEIGDIQDRLGDVSRYIVSAKWQSYAGGAPVNSGHSGAGMNIETLCVIKVKRGATLVGEEVIGRSFCNEGDDFDEKRANETAYLDAISRIKAYIEEGADFGTEKIDASLNQIMPSSIPSPMQGIETPETADNLPQGVEQ